MTFVNEFPSESDIRKYKLDALMAEFHTFEWRNGRPSGFTHAWTVDRTSEKYLIEVEMVDEFGPSGRPEPTTRSIFALVIGGERILATVDHAGGSKSFSDCPFKVVRSLINLDMPKGMARTHVVKPLKDALTAYGYRGAHRQVERTFVVFDF